MADTKTVIEQAYSAFNKRDINGALALMMQDVSWPKASEGGRAVGKEEIRAYWTRLVPPLYPLFALKPMPPPGLAELAPPEAPTPPCPLVPRPPLNTPLPPANPPLLPADPADPPPPPPPPPPLDPPLLAPANA